MSISLHCLRTRHAHQFKKKRLCDALKRKTYFFCEIHLKPTFFSITRYFAVVRMTFPCTFYLLAVRKLRTTIKTNNFELCFSSRVQNAANLIFFAHKINTM